MNFALATLSLALAISTMATGAQAHVMRGSALGRDLEELSLSLSMPIEELDAAELASPSTDAGSKYTAAEQQQFQERFEKTALGAALAKWKDENAAGGSASSSSSSASSATLGKSAKIGFCDNHLYDVLKAVELYDINLVPPPEFVTAACSFGGYAPFGVSPDLGCPVVAGTDGPSTDGYFAREETDYYEFYGLQWGYIAWKFNKYCECHQGYELDCASKIPYPEYGHYPFDLSPSASATGDSQVAGPYVEQSIVYPGDNHKKWQEYCKFVAIWNGDVSHSIDDDDLREEYTLALFDGLSKEVKECGCYFIASAEGMVGECPGVTLFEYQKNTTIV